MGCVYLVTNRINGRQYVGKTRNSLSIRRCSHEKSAKNGIGSYFHNAIRRYGSDVFDWEVLLEESTNRLLSRWERYYIKQLRTKAPDGYNLTDGGDGGVTVEGYTHSEEAKAKIKEYHNRPSVKEKMRQFHTGRKRPKATGLRISMACKGRRAWSKGLPSHYKGKKHSEASRANMREAQNRPEVKAKISAFQKGRPKSAECGKEFGAYWKGKKRRPLTDVEKELRRKTMLEKWKDPEYVAKRTKAHKLAMSIRRKERSKLALN